MILIKKQKEPDAWLKYRLTPNVDYQSIPELVESLCKEQGYICAYCMRRIPCRDNVSNEDHRIEHILSREKHDDMKLDYANMVICCPGHIGTEDHCDKKKGSDDISLTPLDNAFIGTISYTHDGKIKSSNSDYDKELNQILNLNTDLLKTNRRKMIETIVNQIQYYVKKKGNLDKSYLNRMLEKYSNLYTKKGQAMYHPYCGVAIFYLQKKINKLS